MPARCRLAAVLAALALLACGERERAAAPPPAADAPPANTAAPATSKPPPGTPASTADRADGTGAVSAAGAAAVDRDFVALAASSGALEARASQLALERSTSAEVRAFAQRMLDAHARSNERLKAVASAAGLDDAPSAEVAAHAAQLERLRALDGPAFDREFVVQVGVAGHARAVAVFERAAQSASSAQLRAFASEALPALRDRLEQSLALARGVGVPAERTDAAAAVTDVPATTTGGTGTSGSGPAGVDRSDGATSGSSGVGPSGGTGPGSATSSPGR